MIDKNFWSSVATRWTIKDTSGRAQTLRKDTKNITDQSAGMIDDSFLAYGDTQEELDEIDDFLNFD